MTKPRIAVAGIHIESSTFTPYISTADDFIVTRGEELMDRFYWRDEDWATQIEWIPVLHSRALPGGVVERGAYDAWKAEILEGLAAAGPLDGLFFDIHGAMSVQGMDDAEGDLINAIRAVIGPEPMVSASMDLHGNVSQDLSTAATSSPAIAWHPTKTPSSRAGARPTTWACVSSTGSQSPSRRSSTSPSCCPAKRPRPASSPPSPSTR